MTYKADEVTGTLLTIGDEILLGDIPNANAHHIASELRSRGFRLDRVITIGDGEEEIVEHLLRCVRECHFLIVTGGLGPTDDDRTCSAVSRAFSRPLIQNPDYIEWLRKHIAQYGLVWSDQIARMAQLPNGAVKMRLEMAGFFIEHERVPCYFLPGVPHEMKILLAKVVIPDLEERFPRRLVYMKHVLRIQGLLEPQVNERLKDLVPGVVGVEIGYLPQVGENWVTLFVSARSREEALERIKEAQEKIISRLGAQHISGHNDECLEKVIGQQLRSKGWRIAAAESCTGGLLSRKITAIAGASDYFDRAFITYSNEAKMELLGVPEDLLKAYGAVSEPVALAMARGARAQARVDVALAITGIAGPTGGSPQKPVGTVFIACDTPHGTLVEKHVFSGDRDHIQQCAAQAALVLLWRALSDDQNIHCD